MNGNRCVRPGRRGFTMMEMLVVVFILGILLSTAAPAYIQSRRSAQARACRAHLATFTAAESSWALRNGSYTTNLNGSYTASPPGLVGAPDSLLSAVYCPLTGTTSYTATLSSGALTITCPNAASHAAVQAPQSLYSVTLAAPTTEAIP